MNNVEVKVSIDIDSQPEMDALNIFLTSLRGLKAQPVTLTGKIADTVKNVAPVKTVEQTVAQPAKVETAKPVETASAPNVGGSKGIDYIRKLIGQKSGTHRQAMKEKLTELGAATATELTVDKYEEFSTFLEALA